MEKIGNIEFLIYITTPNGMKATYQYILTHQLTRVMLDNSKGNQVKFWSAREFNFEEYILLKTTNVTSTDTTKGKTVDYPIELRENSTISDPLTKSKLRNKGYVKSVTLNIRIKIRIIGKGGGIRETQSSLADILKLLTPGTDANPPGNLTMVPLSPIGVAGK